MLTDNSVKFENINMNAVLKFRKQVKNDNYQSKEYELKVLCELNILENVNIKEKKFELEVAFDKYNKDDNIMVIPFDIIYHPSTKDKIDILYDMLNDVSSRKATAIDELR